MPDQKRILLELMYWYHVGLPAHRPEWVLKHPLWPDNNDTFDKRSCNRAGGRLATPCPGRDRLWEAINTEFGLGL